MRPIALSDKNVGNPMKVVNMQCLTESYVRLNERAGGSARAKR